MNAMIKEGIPHIARNYLIGLGVSKNTINDGRRSTTTSWQAIKHNGLVFFRLDSIPEQTREKYNLSEDVVVANVRAQALAELVRLKVSDLDFFKTLDLDIPAEICSLYHKQAGWFRLMATLKKKNKAYWLKSGEEFRKLLSFKKADDIWESALMAMQMQDLVHHFKATTFKGLRNRVKKWNDAQSEKEQLMSLVHGQYGNENRKIIGKSSKKIVNKDSGQMLPVCPHEAIIYGLYMNYGQPNKLTSADIYNRYVFMIEQAGEEAVSFQTVCRHLGKFSTQVLTSMERHGYTHFMEQHNTYVPAFKPSASNVLVASDGSSVKMYYRFMDKKGKWQRANAYAIRIVDVYSGCIIGYSLAQNETAEGVKDAIQIALKVSGGKVFGEFLSDNGSAFTGEEGRRIIEAVSSHRRNISITKKTKNGFSLHYSNKQSNPAEAFVKYLSSNARQYTNWIAVGRNAKKADNRTNADYMGKVEDLPDFEQLKEQFIELIVRFNAEDKGGVSRWERYMNGFKGSEEQISDRIWRYLFSTYRTEATVNRGFIKIKKQLYEVPNYEALLPKFDKHGSKVSVVFSSDWETADLYGSDDVYITTINLAKRTAKARSEQTAQTARNLGHHQKRKKTLEEKADRFISDSQQAMQLLDEDYALTAKFEQNDVKELSNALSEQRFLLDNSPEKPAERQQAQQQEQDDKEDYSIFDV